MSGRARLTGLLCAAWLTTAVLGGAGAGAAPTVPAEPAPAPVANAKIPVFAYYYIWFDEPSWDRAKSDLPKLGRYNSDDPDVMRKHIRWAKAAGIDGFLVSWKHTPLLDARLERLVRVAEEESFELAIVYQGLDFSRLPLQVDRISTDLDWFSATYAGRAPFRFGGKPWVMWSGTWKYSRDQIARVTDARRGSLVIMASEKSAHGYERVAPFVDGNAYYWSSVNPDTYPRYTKKLGEMGAVVHAHGGIWIAPAAPGFDGRLIGGRTVVSRDEGRTLRRELDGAAASTPDAIGIISWNEFSENSAVEPSVRYGYRALNQLGVRFGRGAVGPTDDNGTGKALRATRGSGPGTAGDGLDSSAVGAAGPRLGIPVLLLFGGLFGGLVLVTIRRARRSGPRGRDGLGPPPPPGPRPEPPPGSRRARRLARKRRWLAVVPPVDSGRETPVSSRP